MPTTETNQQTESPGVPGPAEAGGSGAARGGALEGTGDENPEPGAAKKGSRYRWVVEAAAIVVLALVATLVLRTFVVQPFFIPSGSMEPTLQIGDRILVDKLSYHFHSIDRGDIVVFATPPSEDCGGPPVADLVKRVIGLPGERISSRGNTVLINGRALAEPWLPKGTILGRAITPTVVPANSYFVMGDNRDASCDSRYWGSVPRSLVVGKVVALVWPLSRFHVF